MNALFLKKVSKVYGPKAAADVKRGLDSSDAGSASPVAVLARVVSSMPRAGVPVDPAYNSQPVPLTFDIDRRKKP